MPPADAGSAPELQLASLSDVGLARPENQDCCGEFSDPEGNRLLVLADGMGGHRGGATASRICVETVAGVFAEDEAPLDERLRRGIELANERVLSAATDPELQGMGTTVVALVFPPRGDALVAWVGDSRAYRFRGGRLEALTHDHSVVAEWVRAGLISEEEAEVHSRRNELLRSVGGHETVEVDVTPVDVEVGDRFLLCSDGLSGYVAEAEIAAVLGFESPPRAAQLLVDKANEAGGLDNVTVQVAVVAEREMAPPPPAAAPERASPTSSRSRLNRLVVGLGAVAALLVGSLWFAATYGGGGIPLVATRPEPVEERGGAEVARLEAGPSSESRPDAESLPGESSGGTTRSPVAPESADPESEPADPRAEEPISAAQEEGPEPGERRPSETETAPVVAAAPPPTQDELPFGGSPPGEPIWPAPSASLPGELPSERPPVLEAALPSSAEALPEEAAAGEIEAAEQAALPREQPEASERGDAEVDSAVALATAAELPLPADPPGSEEGGLEQAIDQFLGAWSRSVVEKDYSLHRELGFAVSESEFEQLYGRREELELSFVRLDHSRPDPGAVNVRVLMVFGYRDRTGFHRTEKERDIVLHETESGSLSYAPGSRE